MSGQRTRVRPDAPARTAPAPHPAAAQRRGRSDGPHDPDRPQRLEEALDWGDVGVYQHQRQPQPRGAGGVEKVDALPDGVAGGIPLES
jgi:hypothetical protein